MLAGVQGVLAGQPALSLACGVNVTYVTTGISIELLLIYSSSFSLGNEEMAKT
jgi:hypothetical protein